VSSARRRFAFIAGSGMDAVRSCMTGVRAETPFDAIAGVGACAIQGHSGSVIEGTVGAHDCTLVMGRRHVYEGEAVAVDALIAWLAGRGVTDLITTSAAGALHARLYAGDVVIARDVIDFQNRKPERTRIRLDHPLTAEVERAATRAGVRWLRGTMVCGSGPAYETSAEVRALQDYGDAATMSGVPELAAATRHGVRMAAIALITNPCTGVWNARPNHLEVLEAGRQAAAGVAAIIGQLIC
jgi:purine-nucleoside phosphorylase